MTGATLNQIKVASEMIDAKDPEMDCIRHAIAQMDIAAAIETVRGLVPPPRSRAAAVARQLARQQKFYRYTDCVYIINAIVYEAFGLI